MEVTNQSLDWDSEDQAQWRQFLQSRAGQRLIPKAAEIMPRPLRTGDATAALIRSGEVLGYQDAISNFLALAFPPPMPEKRSDEYPALTDDSAWDDGQTIKAPETK
jgi:hypothetical protein